MEGVWPGYPFFLINRTISYWTGLLSESETELLSDFKQFNLVSSHPRLLSDDHESLETAIKRSHPRFSSEVLRKDSRVKSSGLMSNFERLACRLHPWKVV